MTLKTDTLSSGWGILEVTPLQFNKEAARYQWATDYMRISDDGEGSERQQRLSILWYEMAGGKEEEERGTLVQTEWTRRQVKRLVCVFHPGSAVESLVGVYAGWVFNAYLYTFYALEHFPFPSGQTKGLLFILIVGGLVDSECRFVLIIISMSLDLIKELE